jgi:TRAP-type transport system small permease protein
LIERICDRVARALELALAIAFLFAVGLNFTNVVGRYVFGRSILWADEVQVFIMIAFTFLGAAVVAWRRQHLRMDVLARMLPPRLQTTLKVLELLLMLTLCTFVLVQSQDYASRMAMLGRDSDSAGIPMWIPHGSVAAGFGLMVLVCLAQIWIAARTGVIDPAAKEIAPAGE